MIKEYIGALPLKDRNAAIALINTQISEGSYNPLTIPRQVLFRRARSQYFNGLQLSTVAGIAVGFGIVATTGPLLAVGGAVVAILGGVGISANNWREAQLALEDDDFGYLLTEEEVIELQKCLKAMPNPKDPKIRKACKTAQQIVDQEVEDLGLGEYLNEVDAEVSEVIKDTQNESAEDAVIDGDGAEDEDVDLYASVGVAMKDDPDYQGISNPWDESEAEDPNSFDNAIAWCAEREHEDRIECEAIDLDYDRYMQEVARAMMDGKPRPSPAEVSVQVSAHQQAAARHLHITPASPLSIPSDVPPRKSPEALENAAVSGGCETGGMLVSREEAKPVLLPVGDFYEGLTAETFTASAKPPKPGAIQPVEPLISREEAIAQFKEQVMPAPEEGYHLDDTSASRKGQAYYLIKTARTIDPDKKKLSENWMLKHLFACSKSSKKYYHFKAVLEKVEADLGSEMKKRP